MKLFFRVFLTTVLSIFSTIVLSYISMATPIGPWIAPTLVIVGSVLLNVSMIRYRQEDLAYATAGGSVGGIIATACGFSFPTVYFLAPSIFQQWLSIPWYFMAVMTGLCISAGLFGYLCACLFERSFIVEQEISFPIGQLVYSMITADQKKQQQKLVTGFSIATIFSLLQGGMRIPVIIPRVIYLLPSIRIGAWQLEKISLRLDMLPMLLAIGFIAGHLITIPLLVGAVSKIFVLDVLQLWYFSYVSSADFMLAFCSGIVLIGAVQSFIDLPKMAKQFWYRYAKNQSTVKIHSIFLKDILSVLSIAELLSVTLCVILFLSFMRFNMFQQLFLLVGSFLTTYQITLIAGKIGMAQLGRFATFVMVPALLLFGVDPVHATITASFVEISGGVATDILFGKKLGYLMHLPAITLKRFQLLGLIISSVAIGGVFWLLMSHFRLGSEQLFAQRAQARALLIHAQQVDLLVLFCGMGYGFILKRLKINPLLVLGGLLMPLSYSIGLMIGGCLPKWVKNKETWEPFWSGMFAANSICELIKILF